MKLYWSDLNGNPPPENASFFVIPFNSHNPQQLNHVIRISTLPPPSDPLSITQCEFFPTKDGWEQCVNDTLKEIEKGHLSKAVLARKCTIQCQTNIDPFAFLSHLQQYAQNATLFCLADENTAFLGASPETLFQRHNNQIFVEALAGTTYRGKSFEEDQILEIELLQNTTKYKEIAFVQTFIEKALSPLCETPVHFSKIGVKKTKNVQHLHATASSTLKANISDLDIAKALHPTPALSGTPQKQALHWISQKEPFERGLYGGVIGWSTEKEAHFIVAIRSAFIEQKFIHLYTGCGIVEGSTPSAEWEELNHKMTLYRNLFNIEASFQKIF